MAETTVEIGHDVRVWTTFKVADATDEEIAVLRTGHRDDALALLRDMEAADRLKVESVQHEEDYEYFHEDVNPHIIE